MTPARVMIYTNPEHSRGITLVFLKYVVLGLKLGTSQTEGLFGRFNQWSNDLKLEVWLDVSFFGGAANSTQSRIHRTIVYLLTFARQNQRPVGTDASPMDPSWGIRTWPWFSVTCQQVWNTSSLHLQLGMDKCLPYDLCSATGSYCRPPVQVVFQNDPNTMWGDNWTPYRLGYNLLKGLIPYLYSREITQLLSTSRTSK